MRRRRRRASIPAVTLAAGSTTSMIDDALKVMAAIVVPVAGALIKAAFTRSGSATPDRDKGLPQLSEHRLLKMEHLLPLPPRRRPAVVWAKIAWYVLGLLTMAVFGLAAIVNIFAGIDVAADFVMLPIALGLAVCIAVMLLNSLPTRPGQLHDRYEALLRLTGDAAWIAWASDSAVRRAGLRPRLLDATDAHHGWAVGASGDDGDFLGGRIVLVIAYSAAGGNAWDVTVLCEPVRRRTRFAWGRTSRALSRACDWLEGDARATPEPASPKPPRSGRTWRTRSAGSSGGPAVPAPEYQQQTPH